MIAELLIAFEAENKDVQPITTTASSSADIYFSPENVGNIFCLIIESFPLFQDSVSTHTGQPDMQASQGAYSSLQLGSTHCGCRVECRACRSHHFRPSNGGTNGINLSCQCTALCGPQVRYISCQHNLPQLGLNTAVMRLYGIRNPHCACVLEFEACPAFGDILTSNRGFKLLCDCVIELILCQACRTGRTSTQIVTTRSTTSDQYPGRSIAPQRSRRRGQAAAPQYYLNPTTGILEPLSSMPDAEEGLQPATQQPGQATTRPLAADGSGESRLRSSNSTIHEGNILNNPQSFEHSTLMPRQRLPPDGDSSRDTGPQPLPPNTEGRSDIEGRGSSALALADALADVGRSVVNGITYQYRAQHRASHPESASPDKAAIRNVGGKNPIKLCGAAHAEVIAPARNSVVQGSQPQIPQEAGTRADPLVLENPPNRQGPTPGNNSTADKGNTQAHPQRCSPNTATIPILQQADEGHRASTDNEPGHIVGLLSPHSSEMELDPPANIAEYHTASASGQRNPLVLAGQHIVQSRVLRSPAEHTQERPAREIFIDENYDNEIEDDEKMQDALDKEEIAPAGRVPISNL